MRFPEESKSVTLFSNTPLVGTFGLPGESDQSTVAQPERGCSLEHETPDRRASHSLTTSRWPADDLGLSVIACDAVSSSWNPGSPKALAAGRSNFPVASI